MHSRPCGSSRMTVASVTLRAPLPSRVIVEKTPLLLRSYVPAPPAESVYMLDQSPLQLQQSQNQKPLPMRYQLEVAGESAAIYVSGSLDTGSAETLLEVCRSLPVSIRTLRLDLRSIGAMSACATDAVRRLLSEWRTTRRGEFRLSTSHLVATCSDDGPPLGGVTPAMSARIPSHALVATYL